MDKRLLIASFLMVGFVMASAQTTVEYSVKNNTNVERKSAPVVIRLMPYGSHIRRAVVMENGKEVPSQLDDLNQDGHNDELCFVTDLKGKERKKFSIQLYDHGDEPIYQPRTYAEMVLRNTGVKEKNKHDYYIRALTVDGHAQSYNFQHHHGVAFESELVGFRIYFDPRQTIDLYGKFHRQLEIKDTQFYTDKAQKAKGYGDDVLWVGNTFGLGALRGWNGKEPQPLTDVKYRTQRIISSGPVRSIVEVGDNQWRVDPQKDPVTMVIRYVLYAGHRDVHVTASFSRKVPDLKFSTGIINVKGSKEYSDHAGLRGCWGTDWPAGLGDTINWKRETVGLGICIPRREIVSEQPANQDNYAFVVNTPQDVLQYDIAFCSDNEDFGYHRAEDWFHFLETWKEELSNPVTVSRVR